MNDTFQWSRFVKVLRKDFYNLWPTFGVTGIILAALPFTLWLLGLVFFSDSSIPPAVRLFEIGCFTLLAGLMLPSRLYKTMNLRDRGIDFAMLPASKLEKFLSIMLFSFVVAPLAVFFGGLLVDLVLTLLPFGPYSNWIWENEIGLFFDKAEEIGVFSTPLFIVSMFIGMLYSFSIFLFTATLFRRHKVIFTFLALYAIEFVLSLVLMPIGIMMLENPDVSEWISNAFQNADQTSFFNSLMGWGTVFYFLLFALFVGLSWRRLKRMQY